MRCKPKSRNTRVHIILTINYFNFYLFHPPPTRQRTFAVRFHSFHRIIV